MCFTVVCRPLRLNSTLTFESTGFLLLRPIRILIWIWLGKNCILYFIYNWQMLQMYICTYSNSTWHHYLIPSNTVTVAEIKVKVNDPDVNGEGVICTVCKQNIRSFHLCSKIMAKVSCFKIAIVTIRNAIESWVDRHTLMFHVTQQPPYNHTV